MIGSEVTYLVYGLAFGCLIGRICESGWRFLFRYKKLGPGVLTFNTVCYAAIVYVSTDAKMWIPLVFFTISFVIMWTTYFMRRHTPTWAME